MKKTIELLAPGGDIQSIKAAILAGANAIFCGLDRFNARNRAQNLTLDDLHGILRLAHEYHCKIFLTINIVIVESEIPALVALLNKLAITTLDGIIVQDLGLAYILQQYFPSIEVHGSTQLTTHNAGQIDFLNKLGVGRVNLCRELNLDEIRSLTEKAHANNMEVEVFVHGSNCISFSGICYISSVQSGNSGNRGRCSQTCRNEFIKTPAGNEFPLNMKDNSAFNNLDTLREAGVDSLKIEGRIKSFDYVYSAVNTYRRQLDSADANQDTLYSIFNRDLNNGYLSNNIGSQMFTDNPRDNSSRNLAKARGEDSKEAIDKARDDINTLRAKTAHELESKIAVMNIDKPAIKMSVSGEVGNPLTISITAPNEQFTVSSKVSLVVDPKKANITTDVLQRRFKALSELGYHIETIELSDVFKDLFLPSKELTELKKKIHTVLAGPNSSITPVELPKLQRVTQTPKQPGLSILISSYDDLNICSQADCDIYFQLPSEIDKTKEELIELFTANTNIIPWFPAVLIGREFENAIELLTAIKPNTIVTDNTGVAFEASKLGIPWLAGPQLNTTNSYSLLCLKNTFGCAGAFISNELNRNQIGAIKKPDNFTLHYSIYHPITLMTSRQCLFHQVTGCEKTTVDVSCISDCSRTTSIQDKKSTLIIEKSRGNYSHIYNSENFLNTAIVKDIPNRFDSFMIDLRNIQTQTETTLSKTQMIELIKQLLSGDSTAADKLHEQIHNTTCRQYKKGI